MSTGNGSLPAGWRAVQLGQVCVEDRRIIEARSERAKQLRYLSLEHIESKTGRILREPSEPLEDEGTSTTFAFNDRHVLYGKLRPYLNKVALPDFSGRCTTELIPLLPTSDLAREYLAFLLRRDDTVETAMRGKTGSRMPRANMNALLKMEILLPPLEEQRRIAARLCEQLSIVTEARSALEAQLKAAGALPAANLRAVFESKEAHCWPRQRIDEFAATCSGATPPRGNGEYYNGKIPWVKTGELKDDWILETGEHVSEAAIKDTSLKLLPEKSLLIAMYGQGQTRGRTGLLGVRATTNQACFAIVPNPRFEPEFLQYWFRFSYERLRRETEGRGGNQPNLNGVLLNRLLVPLPSLDEQRAIADKLNTEFSHTRGLAEAIRARLGEFEKLPAALLRAAFRQ